MKSFSVLGFALAVLLSSALANAQMPFTPGTWTKVTNPPPSTVAHMLLLTDGSVLVNSFFFSTHTDVWYRLIPDNTGSYINGTWVTSGNLPSGYNPLYFASAVLPSGNAIVMGGEYNNGSAVWTTKGALLNSSTHTWSSVAAPTGWTTLGDAQSVVLPNGKFMVANCCTAQEAILTSTSPITWAATGTGKADINDEEGWTLLPSGNLLTVDANNGANPSTYEIYTTSAGTWASGGSVPPCCVLTARCSMLAPPLATLSTIALPTPGRRRLVLVVVWISPTDPERCCLTAMCFLTPALVSSIPAANFSNGMALR